MRWSGLVPKPYKSSRKSLAFNVRAMTLRCGTEAVLKGAGPGPCKIMQGGSRHTKKNIVREKVLRLLRHLANLKSKGFVREGVTHVKKTSLLHERCTLF
jgi:hypothetical protein